MLWLVFVVLLLNDEKNTGNFADTNQCLALYRRQTLFRGLNTFRFTCGMRYFNPLIINQVTELTWLCYDLCLLCYCEMTKKIQATLLTPINVWRCIGVKPWSEAYLPLALLVLWGILTLCSLTKSLNWLFYAMTCVCFVTDRLQKNTGIFADAYQG